MSVADALPPYDDPGPPLTRREVEQELVELGFAPEDAPRMVAEYLDETSARVGVRVDNWSLDFADVDAIADSYGWVDHLQDESLDQARERAAGRSAELTRYAANVGAATTPEHLESIRQNAQMWAERARPPAQELAGDKGRANSRAKPATLEDVDTSVACAAAAAAAAQAAARTRETDGPNAAGAAAGEDIAVAGDEDGGPAR